MSELDRLERYLKNQDLFNSLHAVQALRTRLELTERLVKALEDSAEKAFTAGYERAIFDLGVISKSTNRDPAYKEMIGDVRTVLGLMVEDLGLIMYSEIRSDEVTSARAAIQELDGPESKEPKE